MRCSKCGTKFQGNFCPQCGTPYQHVLPVQQNPIPNSPLPVCTPAAITKKKLSSLQITLIVLGAVALFALLVTFLSLSVTHYNLNTARSCISAGQFEQAKDILDSQIQSNDTFQEIYSVYADFYLAQEDYLGAIDILEDGIKRCSSNDKLTEKLEALKKQYPTKIEDALAAQDEQEQKSREEYIASCQSISFTDLARNPERYKGQLFTFTGEVIQVVEPSVGNTVSLRINVTQTEYGSYTDTIYATISIPEGADRILEEDILTIYGECQGMYSYTSVLDQKISLPKIHIQYYSLVQ